MEFLKLLAEIRNPVLNAIMQFFTTFGQEIAFMAIALIVFWCFSKKHGYYILFVGFFGTVANQALKLICRVPRPWVIDPTFRIVESARAEATGYSFPSGHTQNAVGTFGAIALFTKKTWLRWVCVALCLIVPFSRLYLGVHTPLDVGVAFVMALILVFAFFPLMNLTEKKPAVMYGLLLASLIVMVVYLIFVHATPIPNGISEEEASNFTEAMKNGYTLLGCVLGLIVSYIIDVKWLHFDVKAPFWGQILKIVLGLTGVMAVKFGLSAVFDLIAKGSMVLRLVRYFFMVVFAGSVWPLTFPAFAKLGKKKQEV